MAPEVLEEKEYNQQCDMWSVGVILYLMLAGALPFYSEDLQDTVSKIIEAKPPFEGMIHFKY